MARRYASSFTVGSEPQTFATTVFNDQASPIVATAAGSAVWGDENQRLLISPAAYSAVRKVVFWCAFRHEHTDAPAEIPVRLRVAPSSESSTARIIESKEFAESTYIITQGTGEIWSEHTIDDEAVFYAATTRQNSVDTLQFATLDTAGSQIVFQEFDRFEAADADFFNDWDEIAAAGNLDEYVGYDTAIERTDGGTWTFAATNVSTRAPVMVGCGFAVIQAPNQPNNTRVQIPMTFGPGAGAMGTSFSGYRGIPFYYHADEWGEDHEIRYCCRIKGSSGGVSGNFSIQVNRCTNDSSTLTSLYEEAIVRGGATSGRVGVYARSANLVPYLNDGDAIVMQHKSDTGGTQTLPFGWFEITNRNFNITTAYFHCGHPPSLATAIPGGEPPPDAYNKQAGLFDPAWFQDLEDERFLSNRVQGALRHDHVSNETNQHIIINPALDENVFVSTTNAIMQPNVASTPNATTGLKLRDGVITSNDPLNLAGKRSLTERYGGTLWTSGTDDVPGGMGLAYVLDVPNTDVLTLGPLFDLGAFNAEGCAATSAGLGEPPLLLITNGSTIPQKFNPTAAGSAGEIENAGMQPPFEGEVPQAVADDAASSPDGGLDLGIYKYRYTFRNCCTGKESDPNIADIEVDTSGQSPAASVSFSFAGVRIPGDAQICEICLYRTVVGGDYPIMAKVGCFNIDETTVFIDDLSDAALDFTNDGLSILNAPPPCISIIVDFRNRLFGMGDVPNLAPAGAVSVVNGSDIVEGSANVLWDRCLVGKFIQIGEDCRNYEILRILPPEDGLSPAVGRLKLVDTYEGVTDTGLSYTICGRPNRLYYSEPLEPECWPAANFLDIEPGDGDRLMGAVSNFDSLVICKRRKTYLLRFRENPGVEVIVPTRVSSDIGCVGPRTFAQIEVGSVWLSDRGLALYDGRSVQHVPESSDMNDLFVDPNNPHYIRRDRNGRVIDAVGVFYPKREQYLLLLPTIQTDRGCNLMLVWDVKLRNITLLKFCQEFLSMVVGKDSDGNERVYIGDTNGFVWIFDVGDTDGVGLPNATGTVRGTVTFAGIDSTTGAAILDDSSASFLEGGVPGLADLSGVEGLSGAWGGSEMGLAGVCVYTRRVGADYDEPWVVRTVYAATLTRLYVTPEWGPDVPYDDTGAIEFEYMLGAINLDLLFKPQNYGTDDLSKRDWRQIVVHEVEEFASPLRIDLLPDFSDEDPEADTVVDPVTGDTGEGRVFRMDYSKGRQVKPVGRLIHFYMALRMRNFGPEEPIRIINHLLGVNPRSSK